MRRVWEEHRTAIVVAVAAIILVMFLTLTKKKKEQKTMEVATSLPKKFDGAAFYPEDVQILELLAEIPPSAAVLELGAGDDPGASSCCLGKGLRDASRHVLVETDPAKMEEALRKRRESNSRFTACGETLSRCPVGLSAPSGIGVWWNDTKGEHEVPLARVGDGAYTLGDLQKRVGWPVDTLVAHCAGADLLIGQQLGAIMSFQCVVIIGRCIDSLLPVLQDGCGFRVVRRNEAGAAFRKP